MAIPSGWKPAGRSMTDGNGRSSASAAGGVGASSISSPRSVAIKRMSVLPCVTCLFQVRRQRPPGCPANASTDQLVTVKNATELAGGALLILVVPHPGPIHTSIDLREVQVDAHHAARRRPVRAHEILL